MQKKGMISTLISAAHSLPLSITLKCTEAEDWDVIEGDINGKLCLWHWWEACPLLACELRAALTPECTGLSEICETRAECRRSNITSASMTVPMSCVRKIQCVQVYRFVFFLSLHPLISSQGHRKLQTIPACTRRKAGKSLRAFRHTVQTLIHTSGQFRVSSPPDCGRKLAQLKQKLTLGPIVFRFSGNNNINHWVAVRSIFKHRYIIDGLIW